MPAYDTSHLLTVRDAKTLYDDLRGDIDEFDAEINGVTEYNYETGKKLLADGTTEPDEDYCTSEKIAYDWTGSTRYYCGDNTKTDYSICFYGSDDHLIKRYQNPSTTGGAVYRFIDAEDAELENVAYVRFSFAAGYAGKATANASSETPVRWSAVGVYHGGVVDRMDDIEEVMSPDYGLTVSATAASLATGGTLTAVSDMDVRKNDAILFHAEITSLTDLTVGHGYEVNNGAYVTIDATNVTFYNGNNGEAGTQYAQYAHGLTLTYFVNVMIAREDDGRATFELTTGTGQFRQVGVAFIGSRGDVFAFCTGTLTNAKLTAVFRDFNKNIFFFGDSYMSMGNPARWPYYAMQNGNNKFLACGFPGADGSTHEIYSFRNIIARAKPRIVVWCIGMNGSVQGNANAIDEVCATCDSLGIEVVLSTTPCVPDTDRDNAAKNTYVRSLNRRYIDFAKAVGAETNGSSWYTGMLSTDNLHPSALGAQALYAQVLKDLPELIGEKENGLERISRTTTGGASDVYTIYSKNGESWPLTVSKVGLKTAVTGSTPTITAAENCRYTCGTVTSLSFTPCASGVCDVVFTSGSTPAVLTVSGTVLWPAWFDPTALSTNTVYELSILDGTYGAVAMWAAS